MLLVFNIRVYYRTETQYFVKFLKYAMSKRLQIFFRWRIYDVQKSNSEYFNILISFGRR